jgi:hypothetical protein
LPPSFSCNLGAKVRAIKSVAPPGGKGTTKVTGLSGHACAALSAKKLVIQAKRKWRFFMEALLNKN